MKYLLGEFIKSLSLTAIVENSRGGKERNGAPPDDGWNAIFEFLDAVNYWGENSSPDNKKK